MADNDSQVNMLEHSAAKVMLYGKYLAIYLNILARAEFIHRICIFDLFCGEGLYQNDAEGSPLIAIRKIAEHYYANDQTCPNLVVWFNDNGMSQIAPSIKKIDRVKSLVEERFVPSSVQIRYSSKDYFEIHQDAVWYTRGLTNTKSLFFIDPYGYKGITYSHILDTLHGGNNEVLLFLPASFMYRFANGAISSSFPGSAALREFLQELFNGVSVPHFESAYSFIEELKSQLRNHLGKHKIFVDTFTIERDQSNQYCLFFFTSNVVGFEKMVEAKWDMDTERGQGFRYEERPSLFSAAEIQGYPEALRDYIRGEKNCTNRKVRLFGLQQGFLPKHTNQILKSWLSIDPQFEIAALDNLSVRKSTTYVSSTERHVIYSFRDGS